MVNQNDTDPKDRPRITNLSTEIAQLRQELEQQRSDFQTMEISLVSRIADVDDDRRHAATRLQRTHQNHRDEIDMRLRRQNAIVTTTLILFVIIVGVLLVFVYAKFDQARQTFADEVVELRQTLEELKTSIAAPPIQTQDPATREKLSQLSTAVKAITVSLEHLAEDQESLATAEPQPPIDLQIAPGVEPQQIDTPLPSASQRSETATPDVPAGNDEESSPSAPQENLVEDGRAAETLPPEIEEAPGQPQDPASPQASTEPPPKPAAAPTPSEPAEVAEPQAAPQETTAPMELLATPPEEPTATVEPSETPTASNALQSEEVASPPPETADDTEESANDPQATNETAQEPALFPEDPRPEPSPSDPTAPEGPDSLETDSDQSPPLAESALDRPERIQVGETPYSVQVMGFRSLVSLQTFAKRYELKDWLVYDEENYQGRPWYVLIDSLHASRESAESAAAALPPSLSKFDIWVRKLDADDTVYRPGA